MASPLATAEEIPELIPRPGSIVWRRAGDARTLMSAGYALLLQVSHPTVGAGVSEHSDFKSDPWGRLMRTLDFVNVTVYGGPQAAMDMGRIIFELHKRIRGRHADGSAYHALEPEAYAWVHATLAESIISASNRFARPLRPAQAEQFWREWRSLGRVIGVPERELPETWTDFRRYFDQMVERRLQDNQAVRDVLHTLGSPRIPPPLMPGMLWPIVSWPAAHVVQLATVGLLGAPLRERFGLSFSGNQERQLSALAAVMRASTPIMPPQLRTMGPHYLRWRRGPIARGEVARTLTRTAA